jgi:methionyl-tRNA formyltransferase
MTATPQPPQEVSYAAKLDKAEAEMDWSLPAEVLDRKIRAYIPWPMAYYRYHAADGSQHTVKIWQAEIMQNNSDSIAGTILAVDKTGITVMTGHHALKLCLLQLPGKKPLAAQDLLNGRSDWFTVNQLITGES